MWRGCRRKWWYRSCWFDSPPTTPQQHLGTLVHSQIETFLLTGEWEEVKPGSEEYQAQQIALAGTHDNRKTGEPGPLWYLRDLVVQGKGEVEKEFTISTGVLGPLAITGRIDFWAPGLVWDHKTAKDLRAPWLLDEMGISHDVQLLTYAALGDATVENDTVVLRVPEFVKIGHIRYLTTPPHRVATQPATVSRKRLHDHLDDLRGWVNDIFADGHKKHPDEVIASSSECYKYGGCPYKGVCSVTKGKATDKQIAATRTTTTAQARNKTMAFKPRVPAAAPKGSEIKPAPEFEGTVSELAVLILNALVRYGALNAAQLSLATGATKDEIDIAMEHGDSKIEDFWKWDAADEKYKIIPELLAADITQARELLAEESEEEESPAVEPVAAKGINPPDAKDEDADPERAELLVALDAAEKRLGSKKFMELAIQAGIKRPRARKNEDIREFLAQIDNPSPAATETMAPKSNGAAIAYMPVVYANPAVAKAISTAVGSPVGGAFVVVCVP